MIEVADNIHRILAPRLVVTIGTRSPDGRSNIIPINNITSISTEPSMVIIAVYKPWITAEKLKTAKAFTVSVNSRYYDSEISPKGNPKPFMQWERNNFAETSDIISIDYFEDPGF